MKVLVTCPPMIGMKERFTTLFEQKGLVVDYPEVVQTMTERELTGLVPEYDGWIIGDDPATASVFEAGARGKLRAAVKWGVGVDNVDFEACERIGITVTNTPNMFGNEVADVALCYVIGLARQIFDINDKVKQGNWPKNIGISLQGKKAGVIGYGDIGTNVCDRLLACGMHVISYDPGKADIQNPNIDLTPWPLKLDECDFLVFTCSLTDSSFHMFDSAALDKCKNGVRVVNVARGPLIDESALCDALENGKVHSAALDVFEQEPLPDNSRLRQYPLCIFGSHNGSNTSDAVIKTSLQAIEYLCTQLEN